jgi:hypothetical protein
MSAPLRCGECVRFNGGKCPVSLFFEDGYSNIVKDYEPACPAFDSGAYDRAVDALMEILHRTDGYALINPSAAKRIIRDGLVPIPEYDTGYRAAIAAVEAARKERGR